MAPAGFMPGVPPGAVGLADSTGALRLTLPADAGQVRQALTFLGTALAAAGIAPADVADAELVLAEALNNIVEHAFAPAAPGASAPGGDWIELTVVPGAAGIGCELRDNGRPMPDGQAPRPPLPGTAPPRWAAAALDTLPEGGFGWHLIYSLARDIAYAHEAGTNRLVLRIPYAEG